MAIKRANKKMFDGRTSTAMMKRTLRELKKYLTFELDFLREVFLMTGHAFFTEVTLEIELPAH